MFSTVNHDSFQFNLILEKDNTRVKVLKLVKEKVLYKDR